jgi:arylformamidase
MSESAPRRCVDLSHVIEAGMITYRGLPAPLICDFMSREDSRAVYEPGTEFQIGKIEMVGNTGTYMDSPFHRYDGRADLADLQLSRLVDLDCVVIRIDSATRSIDAGAFTDIDVRGKAVLVHTGWDAHWRTDEYFEDHPHLTESAALYLAERNVALVEIDSFNIDSTATGARPVHSCLLGSDIPIVEHLCNLAELPDSGSRFSAAPIPVRRMGSFPVRAYVLLQK